MRKLEKYEESSKRSQTEQESVKQIITYVLSGQEEDTEIGGIPWSTLKEKRKDDDFDHMAFWQTLTKEDQGTLMELLKEE